MSLPSAEMAGTGKKAQEGFSLVELMVAMVIGLLVMGSILQMMISNSESSRINDYLVTAQENGRLSLYWLTRAVHMAGFREQGGFAPAESFYLGPCEGDASCPAEGSGTNNDRLAVLYQPVNGTDCTNAAVPQGGLTADVYYIDADPNNNNINALFCRGYDPVAQIPRAAGVVMVTGVERLQVLYGESAPGETFINQYVTADNVSQWQNIRLVRFGILVSAGQEAQVFDNVTRTYNVLGSGNLDFTDTLPRYTYSTSARVNNNAGF